MMDRAKIFSPSILLLILFNGAAHSAFAALGDVEDSVAVDQAKILGAKSSQSLSTHENYRMHEIKQTNQTVHEFVTKDGKVFAVTWVGPVHPDFSVLFGSYFRDYQTVRAGVQAQGIRRRSGTLDNGELHVEIGGRMASQHGRAWVKSIIPQGFNTDDIR